MNSIPITLAGTRAGDQLFTELKHMCNDNDIVALSRVLHGHLIQDSDPASLILELLDALSQPWMETKQKPTHVEKKISVSMGACLGTHPISTQKFQFPQNWQVSPQLSQVFLMQSSQFLPIGTYMVFDKYVNTKQTSMYQDYRSRLLTIYHGLIETSQNKEAAQWCQQHKLLSSLSFRQGLGYFVELNEPTLVRTVVGNDADHLHQVLLHLDHLANGFAINRKPGELISNSRSDRVLPICDLLYKGASQESKQAIKQFTNIRVLKTLQSLKFLLRNRIMDFNLYKGNYRDIVVRKWDMLIEGICADEPYLHRIAIERVLMYDRDGAEKLERTFALDGHIDTISATVKALPKPRPFEGVKKPSSNPRQGITFYAPELPVIQTISTFWELQVVRDYILNAHLVSIDSEWVPTFGGYSNESRISLLQFACCATDPRKTGWYGPADTRIYLLDLYTLLYKNDNEVEIENLSNFLYDVFNNKAIKLGFNLKSDFSMIIKTHPSFGKLGRMTHLLDLANVKLKQPPTLENSEATKDGVQPPASVKIRGGLSGLVERYLRVPLDKTQQISNWDYRPLALEQRIYAACDVYSLIEVYLKIMKDPEIEFQ